MRQAIIETVHDYMEEYKNSYFVTGDLGFHTAEAIEKDFSERFVNVGVAEQNMIGVASGLALSGKKVFVYSIIPFLTMRCFEQIRNDICYHNLDVTLLGVGAGLSYGILSSTHFALEDIAILRSLPNMNIFSPSDELEGVLGIKALIKLNHPLYVRIGLRTEPIIYKKPFEFMLGRGQIVKQGKDLAFFVNGTLMNEVLEASDKIFKELGLTSLIVDIHTLKPIDKDLIIRESAGKKMVFTIEEHYITGGLGSAIAEILSGEKNSPVLKIIGVEDHFIKKGGNRSYLRKSLGLDSEGLAKRILAALHP